MNNMELKQVNNDAFLLLKLNLEQHFHQMTSGGATLFEIDVDKDALWSLYLEGVSGEKNPFFRKRRVLDCSACRYFFKSIGNTAVIQDGVVHTIWEFDPGSDVYRPVVKALDTYLKQHPVTNLYVRKTDTVGVDKNHELQEDGTILTWEHLFLRLPEHLVDRTNRSEDGVRGDFLSLHNVFRRSLEEITEDSALTVLELIASNSLYRGAEWQNVLQKFLEYKRTYDARSAETRDNFVWEHTKEAGIPIGKIRNHSMGVLLLDISQGINLEQAVRKYERIVAPANYKRSKPVFTEAMLRKAQAELTEMGYVAALPRRFATLDDVTVNNILFANRDASRRISGTMDIFETMKADAISAPKQFSRAEEISIEDFVHNVLPFAKSVEAYVENRHAGAMVSLIAPQNMDAPTMFKWNNAFSWAYSGNITDNDMKQNVKRAGGNVEGVLRFSIQWNDDGSFDGNDLDAHCKHPGGHIYYGHKVDQASHGNLDVDIIHPQEGTAAVENIAWPALSAMKPGKYTFYVNCYSSRGGRSGFRAQIEFNGNLYEYNYQQPLRTDQNIEVAEVFLDHHGSFTITHKMPAGASSKPMDVWGIRTNEFVPVTVIMHSPNYWNAQQGIGNKHYFFMLKDCKNPENPSAFFNEFLKNELNEYRHVLEALGSKLAVETVDDQLSGIGFSSTRHNELIVKVTGATERIMKIHF